ncbi:hypothetical protein SAMN04487981_13214 [Streptomyces sp. cf386]|uniref:hypothetical protein n=1 Tax=Streptomyces sp. cf386 TaxID=1761904 RepID=UPI0008899C59|nr:hypothetical protein [Streptomyces sp. cf386]SDP66947.1 hypothetical protein SAMN04487981_13214 [Streptomyces sp. cf386]
MARPIARLGVILAFGALWWWAVLRLALVPDTGALEAAVAAGGWGLSLLPVRCVPKARAVGTVDPRRWADAWRRGRPTKASPHRRSDAGSAPS